MSDVVDSLLEARNEQDLSKEEFFEEFSKSESDHSSGHRKTRLAVSNFTKGKTLVETVDESTRRNILN
jgi:hypothetical protein